MKSSFFRKSIHTEIHIHASSAKVWAALVNLDQYQEWNPFITSALGILSEGEFLKIFIRLPGSKNQKIKVKIINVIEGSSLRWLGHFKIPGLCDGDHYFELFPSSDGSTRLVHRENFSGLLLPIIWKGFKPKFQQAFTELNLALKNRIETQSN